MMVMMTMMMANTNDDGYTRVVNTNESYNGEKYDPYHSILDNGANITIIKDVQLVTNIRCDGSVD